MKTKRFSLAVIWMLAGLVCTFALPGCGDSDSSSDDTAPSGVQRYRLVSGGQTGVYYPTALAIGRLVGNIDSELDLTVQTSGGSVANARLLANEEADFAIMQNDIAAYAQEGKLMFAGAAISDLRGVAALYPEHVQIVAFADAGIASVTDLRGKRVAIGAIGSGTEANALQILAAYGLSEADLGSVERLKSSEARDYLQDKRVDAAFFTFGVGTASIKELALRHQIVFVPVDGEARKQLMAKYPFYRQDVVAAGAYRQAGNGKAAVPAADVPTVTVTATLTARKGVPDDVVQKVLRGIFENLDDFHKTHVRLSGVNKQDSRDNLSLPLHPGAEAFYGK